MADMLLQPVWDLLLEHSSVFKSAFFPVFFSLGAYLFFCLPYMLLDCLASKCESIRRYKLQPSEQMSWSAMWACLFQTLTNHALFIFPLTFLNWLLDVRTLRFPVQAPPLFQAVLQVSVCLLLFDFQSFIWHLLHHKIPYLYRTFHKLHHTFSAPSALTTEFSGAMETLSLGLFAAANPLMLGCHPLTELAFLLTNICLSVEAHCGYELPLPLPLAGLVPLGLYGAASLVPLGFYGGAPLMLTLTLASLVPLGLYLYGGAPLMLTLASMFPLGLYGGARHHEIHHKKSHVNYAPYFTHWDRLAGTLCTTL